MSRTIRFEDLRCKEIIADMNKCKHMLDDVCACPVSDHRYDKPHPDYCKNRCPHFTKEDGVIAEP